MSNSNQKLGQYRAKRDFTKTQEPQDSGKRKPLIYVIQKHHASRLHYDFRLEHHGVLLSWAVPKGPSTDPHIKRLAVHVEDHPVSYADFEGVIPEGNYGAGLVERWDEGYWRPLKDVDEGLKNGKLEFELHGKRLTGKWALVRMAGEKDQWLLIKEKEDHARVGEFDDDLIAHPPSFQLCTLRAAAPAGDQWFREIKWDGYRAMALISHESARLITRGDQTLDLPEIKKDLQDLAEIPLILDGEIVALEPDGRSNFGLLQRRLKSKSSDLRYVVFDLLALNGHDFRKTPFKERRHELERLLKNAGPSLMISPHIPGSAKAVENAACRMKLEGIVSKRLFSPYSGRRSEDWIKSKCRQTGHALVGGYTLLANSPTALGALLLGEQIGRKIFYRGRVGTGFSDEERHRILQTLKSMETSECPFEDIKRPEARGAHWVKPELLVSFDYQELTNDQRYRQASFKELKP